AELARLANGVGEVGDLDPADLVRLARVVHPADEIGVQCHAGVTAAGLAGLAVSGVAAAVRAELLQLKTVRVVAPVLLGDVVPVLALLASQRDLRPDVGGSHSERLSTRKLGRSRLPDMEGGAPQTWFW